MTIFRRKSSTVVECERYFFTVLLVSPVLSSRPTSSKLRAWCALAIFLSVAPLQAADGIRIVPIVRDGSVLVTFELADGFTADVRAVIQSGLRTTFTYTVDLRLDVPTWVDRTVGTAVVTNTVQFDNLTRRHTVTRTVDGRIEDSLVTDNEETVRQLMTSFDRLPLFRTSRLEPNREYYIRVQAQARPRSGAFLWPWDGGPSGLAKFTFIP